MADMRTFTIRPGMVQEGARFTLGGQVQREVRYTFFVDNDGPFTLTYDAGEDTPEVVKADMQKRADSLRAIFG